MDSNNNRRAEQNKVIYITVAAAILLSYGHNFFLKIARLRIAAAWHPYEIVKLYGSVSPQTNSFNMVTLTAKFERYFGSQDRYKDDSQRWLILKP